MLSQNDWPYSYFLGHLTLKLNGEVVMSNKNDGEASINIKTILLVITCVIIWIVLQSFTGVPMKM